MCKFPALSSGRDKAVMRNENAVIKSISVITEITVQKPNALQVKNRNTLYSFGFMRFEDIIEKTILTLCISEFEKNQLLILLKWREVNTHLP